MPVSLPLGRWEAIRCHCNDDLNIHRAKLAMVSRVAGIRPPIDGVTTNIEDVGQLARDTLNGKRWGFSGKLCIHPKQVATVNQSYAPSAQDIEWARRVLEASREAVGAAVSLDGKMVDRPGRVARAEHCRRRKRNCVIKSELASLKN